MTSIVAILAEGQLPNAEAAIFTATVQTVVKEINFKSTNTTTNRTVIMKIKKSTGVARDQKKFTVPPEGFVEGMVNLTFAIGDEIRAYADVASEVDFVISGYQFPS